MSMLDFPPDIYTHKLFRYFLPSTFPSFCRVSKKANSIVSAVAKGLQDDYAPDGKRRNIKLDGSTHSLALHMLKMHIVTDFPHLLRPVETTKVTIKDVVFDYQTQKIRPNGKFGLGGALEAALQEASPTLVHAVFSHPNAKDIPAHGPWGLGDAMGLAMRINSYELVQLISSHRNAYKIPGDGFWGLGTCLIYAVRNNNLQLVQFVLSQPNAAKIPVKGGISLKSAMEETEKIDSPEIVAALKAARNKKYHLLRVFPKKR